MSRPAQHLQERYRYADYRGWDESVRGELIDGLFYDMTPAPSFRHQNVLLGIASGLRDQLRGKSCKVFIAPTDVLLENEGRDDDEAQQVVQPDLFIVCDPAKLTANVLRGAPDWILEVLSPVTARKDQVKKLALYERGGVREFWLLEPESRVLTIYVQDAANRYGRAQVCVAEGETRLTVMPDLSIAWAEVFDE